MSPRGNLRLGWTRVLLWTSDDGSSDVGVKTILPKPLPIQCSDREDTRCGTTPHSRLFDFAPLKGVHPMHQIVLLTALTATSGLFGGGRQALSGNCGRPTAGFSACAPSGPQFGSRIQLFRGRGCRSVAPSCNVVPTSYVPNCAPAAPSCGQVAPSCGVAPAPQAYPAFYAPAAGGCATGNCAR